MDDVIYENSKEPAIWSLFLTASFQEKQVFPAIDIQKSGTRREDLLLSKEEQEAVYIMRKALNGMKSEDAVEQILNMFTRTKNNAEFEMVKNRNCNVHKKTPCRILSKLVLEIFINNLHFSGTPCYNQ